MRETEAVTQGPAEVKQGPRMHVTCEMLIRQENGTKRVSLAAVLLRCIRKVFHSNLCQISDYPPLGFVVLLSLCCPCQTMTSSLHSFLLSIKNSLHYIGVALQNELELM